MTDNNVHEATRHMTASIQEANQAIVNSAVAAQERNVKFIQSVLANGTEVLQAHGESTRDLAQTLAELSRRQQEAFQTVARGSFDTFVDFLTDPFSYNQQVLETAGSAAGREVEAAQQSTREGVAATPKATRQAQTK